MTYNALLIASVSILGGLLINLGKLYLAARKDDHSRRLIERAKWGTKPR